jgi:Tfp pilus assembly protein PilX
MVQGKRYPRTSPSDEKGMALVAGLLLVAVLMLLGTTAVMTSTTDMKISGNYKSNSQAFFIAEAGIENARGNLRTDLDSSSTSAQIIAALSQKLATRVGANGALSNCTNSVNFYAGGAFVTDDVPYIAATSFGGGTYRVYLTNDVKNTGGVTSTTDTNRRVTLTSFGQGPNNTFSIVQQVVEKLALPPLPGAIVLPGPGVNFHGGHSNVSSVDGGVESAVTLTSEASRVAVVTNLTSIGKLGNYTCNSPPCINNESATIDPIWKSAAALENLYNELMSMADVVVGTPTTTTTLTSAQVGTTANRKIVVVNGNAVLGPVNGAGILIVTGQLTLNGNFNYNGFIMCIGQGNLLRDVGGNGDIHGSILVAKTRDSSNNILPSLGTSSSGQTLNSDYNTNGGSNSDIAYDPNQFNMPPGAVFIKRSWKDFKSS